MSGPHPAVAPPDLAGPPTPGRRRVLAAVVAAAGIVAYHRGLGAAFHFDDFPIVVENRALDVLWPPTVAMGSGLRPLSYYSFALSRAVTGDGAAGYRAVNLALHVLAAVTLFALVRRTLRLPRIGFGERAAESAAFAAALLWVVHPLNSQAVVSVVQRAEVMAGLAALLLHWCLVRGVACEAARPRRLWFAAGVLAFWTGLGCKEVVATAPITLYLFDAVLVTGSFAAPLRLRGALYAALAVPFLPLFWLAFGPGAVGFLRPAENTLPVADYVFAQGRVVVEYLRLAVLPTGLHFDHRFDPAEHALLPSSVAVAGIVVATAVGIVRRSPAGFLAAAFLLALAPTSSVFPIDDLLVEHRMYAALVPCVLLVVLGVSAGLRRAIPDPGARRLAASGLLAAAAGALTCLTIARTEVYASATLLWTDVLSKSPRNARAHYNLGLALFDPDPAADPTAALAHFRRAAELDPTHVRAHTNAGTILASRGDAGAAAEHFRAAVAHGPPSFDLLANLGAALLALRRDAEAREVLERALARLEDEPLRRPREPRLRNDLGACAARLGDLAGAEGHFRRVTELDPSLAPPRANLARILVAQGRIADAAEAYLGAVRRAPGDLALRVELATLCANPAHRGALEPRLAEALARDPTDLETARCLEFVRNAR